VVKQRPLVPAQHPVAIFLRNYQSGEVPQGGKIVELVSDNIDLSASNPLGQHRNYYTSHTVLVMVGLSIRTRAGSATGEVAPPKRCVVNRSSPLISVRRVAYSPSLSLFGRVPPAPCRLPV
jgi:hypothetical protein